MAHPGCGPPTPVYTSASVAMHGAGPPQAAHMMSAVGGMMGYYPRPQMVRSGGSPNSGGSPSPGSDDSDDSTPLAQVGSLALPLSLAVLSVSSLFCLIVFFSLYFRLLLPLVCFFFGSSYPFFFLHRSPFLCPSLTLLVYTFFTSSFSHSPPTLHLLFLSSSPPLPLGTVKPEQDYSVRAPSPPSPSPPPRAQVTWREVP